ncbi:hypothetical protein [Bacillus sp. AFS055030]|uniref:hypothetical protein n=1 Tax=Bacillus sp. AFS055030 TaxID=2033507 RepID=UPI000BFE7D39|nr:hypothetical protein [Bacillus sp. AFS055030]PGL72324.1 hypothetical protein CN925_04550 [Bacillus sp. AFS055030]
MKKKIKSLFVMILSFSFLTACNGKIDQTQSNKKETATSIVENITTVNSTENEQINVNDQDFAENVKVLNSAISFAVTYNDVNQLMKDSELAVEGVVLSTENYVNMDEATGTGNPLTKLSFKVNHVLKGDSSLVGKKITILEQGGYISARQSGMKDKFPNLTEKDFDEIYFVIPDGHRPSVKGDEFVAFLSSDSYFNTGFDFYEFITVYQSKFKYDKNSKE